MVEPNNALYAVTAELLKELRNNVQASTIESDISDSRREYRVGLLRRVNQLIENQNSVITNITGTGHGEIRT